MGFLPIRICWIPYHRGTIHEIFEALYYFLKPRASWGRVGNQDVPSGQFLSNIGVGTSSWLIGNKNTSYAGVPTTLNPVLTWETVQTLDFGADARLFNDKMGINFDWFQRKTLNMLGAGQVVPSSFGGSSPMVNYGELTTNGFEIAIDYNHTFKNDLHILLSASLSDYSTKITKFASASDPNVYNNYEGKQLGKFGVIPLTDFFRSLILI